jgi:hypothetical protein
VDKIRAAQRLKFAACFIVLVVAIFFLPGILRAQTPPPPPIMMGSLVPRTMARVAMGRRPHPDAASRNP